MVECRDGGRGAGWAGFAPFGIEGAHDEQTGKRTFAGAGVDRHAGRIIGYDNFTGHFYPKQDRSDIWVSFALKNGTISAVVHFESTDTVSRGRVLNGTGKYRGARGTITARPGPQNPEKTYITLKYHL
jgi:hypothetical protein